MQYFRVLVSLHYLPFSKLSLSAPPSISASIFSSIWISCLQNILKHASWLVYRSRSFGCFNGFISVVFLCFLPHGHDASIFFHSLNLFCIVWFYEPLALKIKILFSSETSESYYPARQRYIRAERNHWLIYLLFFLTLSLLRTCRYFLNVDRLFLSHSLISKFARRYW
jgi:hypothetical protein